MNTALTIIIGILAAALGIVVFWAIQAIRARNAVRRVLTDHIQEASDEEVGRMMEHAAKQRRAKRGPTVLLALLLTLAPAAAAQEAIPIEQGTPAQITGFIIDRAMAEECLLAMHEACPECVKPPSVWLWAGAGAGVSAVVLGVLWLALEVRR